ncbi:MAG TPA: hypothetical protein VLA23_03845 [Candidatus Limnocylindrales bacterium]|nr:hypothetical protein [Candidatus Limnocylindrales bacterium]
MRRVSGLTAALLFLVAASAAVPKPGLASCAGTVALEQVAREPGSAVFTGRATGVAGPNDDVLFAVDRWFQGPEAARVVVLLGWSAVLLEPPTTGVVPVALAKTVSGDAISLVRDEAVLMIATWTEDQKGFGVYACSVAGVPLDSREGRDALKAAEAVFGPGQAAADLPATDTPAATTGDGPQAWIGLRDWWPLVFAFAMAAVIVLMGHRTRGRAAAPRP